MILKLPASMFIWTVVILGLLSVTVLSGLIDLTPATIGIVVICLLCEMVDSSVGMGFGTTLTPVLLLAGYAPHQLVPTILISEFLSGFASFFFHAEAGNVRVKKGSAHVRTAVVLSACSIVGVGGGVTLAVSISGQTLTRIIGAVILAAGVVILAAGSRRFAFRYWKVGTLGLIASFNKAISGGGYGPLMTSGQILSGVEGRAAIGITSLAEGFTCLAGSIGFLLLGEDLDPRLLVPVASGALLAVPASAQVVKMIREDSMKRIIAILTVLLGIFTLVKSFSR